jgi:succinate dehydrogenase flavin-adding protein (antitoxin of CptAB toxin-antitoxin module)
MDSLPEEFMLEEEYAMLEGEQQKEFDEMMKDLDPDILRRLKEDDGNAQMDDRGGDEDVDSKKILDVLKQDLGGRL